MRGARERLAPIVATALATGLALLPALAGIGPCGQRDRPSDGRGDPGRAGHRHPGQPVCLAASLPAVRAQPRKPRRQMATQNCRCEHGQSARFGETRWISHDQPRKEQRVMTSAPIVLVIAGIVLVRRHWLWRRRCTGCRPPSNERGAQRTGRTSRRSKAASRNRMTLSERAAERIGVETAPVAETAVERRSRSRIIPYAAVIYDAGRRAPGPTPTRSR